MFASDEARFGQAEARKLRHAERGRQARAMKTSWLAAKPMSHQKAESMKP